VRRISERTVAGYEVLLEHYRRLQALLHRCADEIPVSEWGDLDLYEAVRKAGE